MGRAFVFWWLDFLLEESSLSESSVNTVLSDSPQALGRHFD